MEELNQIDYETLIISGVELRFEKNSKADEERIVPFQSVNVKLDNGLQKEIRFSTNVSYEGFVFNYIRKNIPLNQIMKLVDDMSEARIRTLQKIINGLSECRGKWSPGAALCFFLEYTGREGDANAFEHHNFVADYEWAMPKVCHNPQGSPEPTKEHYVAIKDLEVGFPLYDWLFSNRHLSFEQCSKVESFRRSRQQRLLFGEELPVPRGWKYEEFKKIEKHKIDQKRQFVEGTPNKKVCIATFLGKTMGNGYREYKVRYTQGQLDFEPEDLHAFIRKTKDLVRGVICNTNYVSRWAEIMDSVGEETAKYLYVVIVGGTETIETFEKDNFEDNDVNGKPLEHFFRYFNRVLHYETNEPAQVTLEGKIQGMSGVEFIKQYKTLDPTDGISFGFESEPITEEHLIGAELPPDDAATSEATSSASIITPKSILTEPTSSPTSEKSGVSETRKSPDCQNAEESAVQFTDRMHQSEAAGVIGTNCTITPPAGSEVVEKVNKTEMDERGESAPTTTASGTLEMIERKELDPPVPQHNHHVPKKTKTAIEKEKKAAKALLLKAKKALNESHRTPDVENVVVKISLQHDKNPSVSEENGTSRVGQSESSEPEEPKNTKTDIEKEEKEGEEMLLNTKEASNRDVDVSAVENTDGKTSIQHDEKPPMLQVNLKTQVVNPESSELQKPKKTKTAIEKEKKAAKALLMNVKKASNESIEVSAVDNVNGETGLQHDENAREAQEDTTSRMVQSEPEEPKVTKTAIRKAKKAAKVLLLEQERAARLAEKQENDRQKEELKRVALLEREREVTRLAERERAAQVERELEAARPREVDQTAQLGEEQAGARPLKTPDTVQVRDEQETARFLAEQKAARLNSQVTTDDPSVEQVDMANERLQMNADDNTFTVVDVNVQVIDKAKGKKKKKNKSAASSSQNSAGSTKTTVRVEITDDVAAMFVNGAIMAFNNQQSGNDEERDSTVNGTDRFVPGSSIAYDYRPGTTPREHFLVSSSLSGPENTTVVPLLRKASGEENTKTPEEELPDPFELTVPFELPGRDTPGIQIQSPLQTSLPLGGPTANLSSLDMLCRLKFVADKKAPGGLQLVENEKKAFVISRLPRFRRKYAMLLRVAKAVLYNMSLDKNNAKGQAIESETVKIILSYIEEPLEDPNDSYRGNSLDKLVANCNFEDSNNSEIIFRACRFIDLRLKELPRDSHVRADYEKVSREFIEPLNEFQTLFKFIENRINYTGLEQYL